jgi:hypothetical protein
MKKANGDGPAAGQQPDDLERRKLVVNLGNIFVRLPPAKRRKAITLLERFTFGKASSVSYWDRWTKEGSQSCYLRLKLISPKMADYFRRWASEPLKAGGNIKLALKCLVDDLTIRTWIEES